MVAPLRISCRIIPNLRIIDLLLVLSNLPFLGGTDLRDFNAAEHTQCFEQTTVTFCSLVASQEELAGISSESTCLGTSKMTEENEEAAFEEIMRVSTKPLLGFAIDYGHEVVAHNEEDEEISLTFDSRGGARWRSHVRYEYGTFTVNIKTPEGNTSGLNTSFYLSSLEGDEFQDEIDFEFLGKDKGILQSNYYTEGVGNREEVHELGFDSSEDFHEYTISWQPSTIVWLIDGVVVRTAEKNDGEAFPLKPMYLYASMWNAGDIDEGRWAGSYTGSHEPYVGVYRSVRVPLNHSESD